MPIKILKIEEKLFFHQVIVYYTFPFYFSLTFKSNLIVIIMLQFNYITNNYFEESSTMLKQFLKQAKTISYNSKYLKSCFYKFGGVSLPPAAIPYEKYLPHLQKIFDRSTLQIFAPIYVKMLHVVHNKNYQLLGELVHDQIQQIQLVENTKFVNKESDIKIYFGDCVFGHYTIMDNYLGYKLDCFQQAEIDKAAVTFNKMPYELTYIQQKKLGIYRIFEIDHTNLQGQQLINQVQDFLSQFFCKKFKISLEIFFESKAKLVPARHAFNKSSQQKKQVHQMRIQLQGRLNHFQIHFPQFKSVFMNNHSDLQQVARNFSLSSDDWRVVQMDHSHSDKIFLLK